MRSVRQDFAMQRLALVLLVACGSQPKPHGELATAADCADTCCLPHPEWFGRGSPSEGDLANARAVATAGGEPAAVALALRVIANRPALADRDVLARLVDDPRPAGDLPEITITQAVAQCYPVRWRPASVGGEALGALARLHATTFADPAAYREWAAAHADPAATFDHWYAVLGTQRPPEPEALAALEKREPLLVARVLAAYCEADRDCARLGERLRATLGGDRALRWLARSESFPKWQQPRIRGHVASSLLRHGEIIFGDAQYAGLEQIYQARQLPAYQLAWLAVVMARVRPRDAHATWRRALADLPSDQGAVLREIAARAPRPFADVLVTWFAKPGFAEPILEGLGESDASGAPVFRTLASRTRFTTDDEALPALAAAARHHGCTGVPDPQTLHERGGKNASIAARTDEKHRVHQAREAALAAIRACAP